MKRDPRAYLWDIQDAAHSIASFLTGVDVKTYGDTPLVHSAVERKFEIIGEALNALWKTDPELANRIPDAGKIIAFRNLLIHGYAAIKHERVWTVAKESLPQLLSTVELMLRELDSKT